MEFEDWRPTPQLRLLWLNTAMLVLSSIAMQWAQFAARRGEIDGVWVGLLAGGVFAVAFLGGQILAWRQLNMLGAFDITNPAIGFFYLSPRCTGCICWAAWWPGAEPPPRCGAVLP